MKRFIVTDKQLKEFVEKKKGEKVFNKIIEDLHKNVELLSENISHIKANQSVINNYKRKKLITPKVFEMLVKGKIIDENYKIME
jgi:hypothetical protein